MRPPTRMPRRRVSSRTRVVLAVVAAVLFVLIYSMRGIAGFYTDFLWFDSLGYASVWRGVLGARIALALIFIAAFFVLMWVNLAVADRIAPRIRPAGPEEEVLVRYHETVGSRTGLVRLAVSGVLAFVAGVGAASQWHAWILFTNAGDFGWTDPQFGLDAGFYVFRLPFLDYVVSWLFAALVIVLLVTAAAHYLNGGIRLQVTGQRVTPGVKAHLSVLLAVLAAVRGVGYWLDRYELVFSTRGVVDGATFTDVHAQLPALTLLTIISGVSALLFIVNIRQRGWVLPTIAVVLWGFVAVVAGAVYPWFVQRFQVEPAESTKEAEFIARNIEATRFAMGLSDDKVEVIDFAVDDRLTPEEVASNPETIDNIRLLDPLIVKDTFQRLQEVRGFYRFNDLDVDRYRIDDETRQVVLSVRELDLDDLPASGWEAEHLAYTHGYGIVVAPANEVTPTGRPVFVVRDLPPEAEAEDLSVTQPAVYFGEGLDGYAIVGTDRPEIDYVANDGTNVTTSYAGRGGVSIGSVFRRFAFFLRFGDIEPLISNFIRSDSRVLYIRDIRDRVETVAPFLHYDSDPYPVLVDGRILWVVDAFTTTDRFPYAQRADVGSLPTGSGLNHRFNYVRNSAKVVVDAYHGTVDIYVMDPTDPLIGAYRRAFPALFRDLDEMPEGLRDNLRYPEDLFRVQTNMWGRYHISGPTEFYEQSDAWVVAQDPGTSAQRETEAAAPDAVATTPGRVRRMDPYYLQTRLPGDERTGFIMIRPFVPFSDDDSRKELQAFMVAYSDLDGDGGYGRLRVFVMPRDDLPDGPAIVNSNIQSDTTFSTERTLLNQQGSQLLQGNLLLVPVGNTLLWVRPIYVQADAQGGTAVPELKRVILVVGDDVVVADTLQEGLARLTGEAPTPPEPTPGESQPPGGTPGEGAGSDLLAAALSELEAAEDALRSGDLGAYQEHNRRALELLRRHLESTAPPTTTTTVPPSEEA